MPKKSGAATIKVDEHFISEVRDQLLNIRNQISIVRGGVNPNSAGHTHGMPLANVQVIPGAGGFASGADVKAKVLAAGGQVDSKLGAIDQKLDRYAQNLDHILASADNVELNNMSLTDFGAFTA